MIAAHHPTGAQVHLLEQAADVGALCGTRIHANRAGDPTWLPATPAPLGNGAGGRPLHWCPKCLGLAAVAAGREQALADLALSADGA